MRFPMKMMRPTAAVLFTVAVSIIGTVSAFADSNEEIVSKGANEIVVTSNGGKNGHKTAKGRKVFDAAGHGKLCRIHNGGHFCTRRCCYLEKRFSKQFF